MAAIRSVGFGTRRTLAVAACLALVAGCGGSGSPLPTGSASTSLPAASPVGSAAASPAAGSWVAAGTLAAGRLGPKAIGLGDGRVIVVGDDSCFTDAVGGGPVEVEVWDPATNAWTTTAGLGKGRGRFVAVSLPDGRAFVAGGMNASEGSHNSVLFQSYSSGTIYDPAAMSWSPSALMIQARTDPAGVVLADGRVLVMGGYYAERPGSDWVGSVEAATVAYRAELADAVEDTRPPAPILRSAEIYDPSADRWIMTGSLALHRYGMSAVRLADGRVLVVGQGMAEPGPYSIGRDGNDYVFDGEAFSVPEVYDPATGRFATSPELPVQLRRAALVALADGTAMLIGGYDMAATRYDIPVTTVLRFDPTSGRWSVTGSLAIPRADAVAVRLADGRVLVAGGEDPYGPTASAELYDPATGTWSAAASMPEPRGGGMAVVLRDGSVLIVGGFGPHSHGLFQGGCPSGLASAVRYIPGS